MWLLKGANVEEGKELLEKRIFKSKTTFFRAVRSSRRKKGRIQSGMCVLGVCGAWCLCC